MSVKAFTTLVYSLICRDMTSLCIYRQLRMQQRIRLHLCLFLSFITTSVLTLLWDVLVYSDRLDNPAETSIMFKDTVGQHHNKSSMTYLQGRNSYKIVCFYNQDKVLIIMTQNNNKLYVYTTRETDRRTYSSIVTNNVEICCVLDAHVMQQFLVQTYSRTQ